MSDEGSSAEKPRLRIVTSGRKDVLSPPRLTFIAAQATSVYEHLATNGVHLLGTDLPVACPFSHIEVDGHNYDYDGINHTENPQQYSLTAFIDVRPGVIKGYFDRSKIDDIANKMTGLGYEVVYEDAVEDWEFDHLKITRDGRIYFLDFRFPDYDKGWKYQNVTYLREPPYTGPARRQINFRSDPRVLPQGEAVKSKFDFKAEYYSYAEALSNVTTAILAENSVSFSLTLTPQ